MAKTTQTIVSRDRVDHSRDELRQDARQTRIPINGVRNILTVPEENRDPAKHYCWVNDDDKGSIIRFQNAGYEFVQSNSSTGETTVDRPNNSTESVVWKNVGQGMIAYLMAIPNEYYEADREEELRLIADQEMEMFRGFEGSYVKSLDFKVGSKTKV